MLAMPSWFARRGIALSVSAALLLLPACSSDTPDPTGPGDPTISISINPASGTIEQGGSAVITGTATIGGNFTGAVTFSITGLPAGVTGTVGTVTVSGTTATAPITVNVGASVAPGTYTGTITASGSGVTDDVSFSLTVTATPTPAIALGSIDDISLQQGASGTRPVSITRTGGFTGDVTIAVEGAPTGLTATPNPATTSGTTSTITIDTSGGVAVGTYTLTVRASGTGVTDVTTTFDVVVTAPPAGTNITADFSTCTTDEQPVWFAYMDGPGGSWMPVTGVGAVFDFTVSEDVVGITVVLDDGVSSDVSVDYFTLTEVLTLDGDICGGDVGNGMTGTISGTVGALNNITFGGVSTQVFTDGIFGINGFADGAQDLVAYSTNSGGGSDRMLILRDQTVANGGDIGTIDLTADGFDPATAAITVGGLVGGESGTFSSLYATSSAGSVCAVAPLQTGLLASPFTFSSAPAPEQASDEFHVATIAVVSGDVVKSVSEAFATLVGANVLIHGHEPCPEGYATPNDRQIILDCCSSPACYLLVPADKSLSHAELAAQVQRLG